MIILFNNQDGEIFYAVADANYPLFTHTTNIPLQTIEVDEIEENKEVVIDMLKNVGRLDVNGLGKYYVSDDTIYQREGWQEWIPL